MVPVLHVEKGSKRIISIQEYNGRTSVFDIFGLHDAADIQRIALYVVDKMVERVDFMESKSEMK